MGECWRNSTRPFYTFFSDCDYSSEDWTTVTNIISAWGDITCFSRIFQEACTNLIRTEIFNHSFNSALEVGMETKTAVMGILEVLLSPDLVPMSPGIKLVLFHME